jgi:hypothetical protein
MIAMTTRTHIRRCFLSRSSSAPLIGPIGSTQRRYAYNAILQTVDNQTRLHRVWGGLLG